MTIQDHRTSTEMTTVTVTCPNGHQNPAHQHFCGECGAALAVICPNGHQNPPHQHFCGECGTQLRQEQETRQEPQPSSNDSDTRTEGLDRIRGDDQSRKEAVEPAGANVLSEDDPDSYVFRQDQLKVDPTAVMAERQKQPHTTQPPPVTEQPPPETVQCPKGHINPAFRDSCRECGAPIGTEVRVQSAANEITPSETERPPKRSLRDRPVAMAVLGVVLAGAVVALLFAANLSGGSGNQTVQTSSGTGNRSATGSTLDDWEAAVCKPGTLSNSGNNLRNADASGSCMSLNGGPIMIGQYTSSFGLQSDMAIFRGASYATIPTNDGRTCVFVAPFPGAKSASALEPLTQFGFQINSVPMSGY
jgi:hypothetical protein